MPTHRQPLAEIDANRAPNQELSNDAKQRLYGRALAGQSNAEIARAEKLPKSTVTTSISTTSKRRSTNNKPRPGRPKLYTARDARVVLRAARKSPKWTYQQIRDDTGLHWSSDTLRTILHDFGLVNWRCKKRPHLTQQHARLRLRWAYANRHTDWSTWLFSDECSLEKGSGKKRQWAFGYPQEKWTYSRIEEYPKGKQASVMVWAMIGSSVAESEFVIMEQDQASPQSGYTARSYIQTLGEGLVPHYDGQTFMQDNASIHTANATQQWFQQIGIYAHVGWPPYSPDLNPIEHIWFHLKQAVYDLRPDLDSVDNKARQLEILLDVLPEAWHVIRREIVQRVLDPMPRRVQAVIDSQGWRTKY